MPLQILPDSQWINGLDSINYTIGQGSYQWAQNIVCRGGMAQTRQGFAEIASIPRANPRGCVIIEIGGVPYLLAAIGSSIYKLDLRNNNNSLVVIPGLSFPSNRRQVQFEVCVQAQETVEVTPHTLPPTYFVRNLTVPKFVVVIQDGVAEPQYWDGTHAGMIRDLYPAPANRWTKKGTFMKWVGDRLWIANGRQLYASDLLNPFQFHEQTVTASGGFFFLPDTVKGMGVTHDYKSLLVFTDFTTSAFQVGLEDRTVWPNTQDFQRVILPSIGCASHRTIINQYGMTWWMSHDGLVGLDNALSAYQSSKLDIQDQNMIRSKEGLQWSSGGGCAGSYGNFLFFSVPSGDTWNNHTWALDQAVINTVQGMTPPAWCANWTGIKPEQWVTGQVNGHQRCFCVSRDLVNDVGHQATVWEAFIGQRMDVPKVDGVRKAKDIGCAFESRFFGLAPHQYIELRWLELDVAEIVGDVALQVWYCGRRTSYKQIINTHLTSTVTPKTEEEFGGEVKVFVPQFRTIRSYTATHQETDNNPEIQTPYLRNIDREFSVLVTWSGQMAVTAIRLAVDPRPDYQEGGEFPDEYLARRLEGTGAGDIGCTLPPPNAPTGNVTSKFLAPQRPRWVELPSYDSAVPNGVFFVTELTASPPPGAYPSSSFPITVNLGTDTIGSEIWFTTNNQHPHGEPNHVGTKYDEAHKPSVGLNQTLRARGERDNMQPSVELHGQYVQAQVARPVLTPAGGNFPPESFPPSDDLEITMTCATAGAIIHWTNANHEVTEQDPQYDPHNPPRPHPGQTIRARAFKQYYIRSLEASETYNAMARCITPTCSPDGGEYPSTEYNPTKTIAIATATVGAKLRYTLNDTDVEHGTLINNNHGNVEVSPDDVLRVIAQKNNLLDSLTKTATYTAERNKVANPELDPDNAVYYGQNHTASVVFNCSTPNATVAYTLEPAGVVNHPTHTNGTHINTFPTTITFQVGHKVIRAIAFRQDMDDSDEVVGEYDHEGN